MQKRCIDNLNKFYVGPGFEALQELVDDLVSDWQREKTVKSTLSETAQNTILLEGKINGVTELLQRIAKIYDREKEEELPSLQP